MKYFVDTNIFVRLYEGQMEASNWIRQIKGMSNCEIIVPAIVIEEIVWLLGKFYKAEKKEIVDFVEAILGMSNVKIKYDYEISEVAKLFKKLNVKFNDCVIASTMDGNGTIVSNDRDFDRFVGIKRVEPKDLL
jgi:predicted nucleic acid-binding protein